MPYFLCTKEEVPAPVLQKFSPFFPQDLVKMMITFLSAFAHYWQPKKIEICWRQKVAITVAHCLKITQNVAFKIFSFVTFHQFFVLLKLTCLVTLFDGKLQVFKTSPKLAIFGIFNELLATQNVNVARFTRKEEWDFFLNFQTLCSIVGNKLHSRRW